MGSVKYTNTIVLPVVENIHQALVAFLRTSELGEWSIMRR